MDLETDITVDDEAAGCIWLVTGKIAGEGTSVCWKTTKKKPRRSAQCTHEAVGHTRAVSDSL